MSKRKTTPEENDGRVDSCFDIRRNSDYMNIYARNLAMETTDDELKQAFSVFGEVKHVVIVGDEQANR
ncbi:MAG: RNA-binding protein [Dehalococcoidales bacterium]|nr:RNA-binding protein [Dehalococcoidales bacterium]